MKKELPPGRTTRALSGLFTGIIQYGLIMLLQFILIPVVLRYAGKEVLGAYSFLIQMIAWGALTDLGFSVATGRKLAQTNGLLDRTRFKEVFETGRTFSVISNIFLSALILMVSWKISAFIHLEPIIEKQAKQSLLFLACWVAIKGTISLYGDALNATQHLADVNIIQSVVGAVRILLSIVFVIFGWALVGLMIANILAEIMGFGAQRQRYRNLYSKDIFRWGIKNKKLFNEMLKFGFTYMILIIGGKLFNSTDGIVIGVVLGANAISVNYVTQMPGAAAYQLLWRISDNSYPAINEIYAKKNTMLLTESYISINKISIMLAICLSVGLLCLNRSAIYLWAGKDQYAGALFTIAVAGLSITQVIVHVCGLYLLAVGRIKLIALWGIISGVIKVAISIILVRKIGISGGIISSFLIDIVSLCIYCIKANRSLFVPASIFLRSVVFPSLKSNMIPCIILIITINIMPISTWINFIIIVCIYLLSFCVSAWIFGISKNERGRIVSIINSIRGYGRVN